MTVAVSTPPGTSPPDKYGGDPVAFDAAMQAHLTWQTSMISELNAQNAENNSLNAAATASASAAASSASSASTSASTATTKASEASASASAAASSASAASSSASSASSSASSASSSATSASNSAIAAAASAASIASGPVSSVNGRVGAVTGVQDTLVSGSNIKTVNGSSIVGSGNLAVGDVTLTGSQTLTNKTLTSPALTTPTLGVASATTINKVTITTPDTGATLTIADGKTLTALKTFSFTAADDTGAYTLPTGTKTLVATDVATLSSLVSVGTITTGTWNATAVGVQYGGTGRATGTTAYGLIAAGTTATGAQQTLAAGATTEILVGGGESALPVWTTATGLGAPVRANSPTLTTPILDTESVAVTTNNLPVVRPTLLLDFANLKTVDPRITFTRASTALRTNANGLLESVASGVPRIDYDPVTLACKGLLIEESRTNLLTYSEQFDNAAWTKTRSSISANVTTAPDGTVTADKLVEDSTATSTHQTSQSYTKAASAITYTGRIFAKAAERTEIQLLLSDFAGGDAGVFINLNSGVTSPLAISGTFTSASVVVTQLLNGWWDCKLTATSSTSTTIALITRVSSAGNIVYTGDGTSGIYIWGAQLEAGAFATSYVPTTSAQVTRAADVASMTSTNFSSWYRADEGSFVVTSDEANSVSGFPRKFTVHDGTANNTIQTLTFGSSDALIFSMTTSGVTQASQIAVSEYTGQTASVAVAYKANDSASSANGATATVDSSCTPPSGINALRIGASLDGTEAINGHIARIAYYPKRLANSTLQALSTL